MTTIPTTIVILILIGILLLLVEMFVPGIILGVIGVTCILIGLVMGFMQSAAFGMGLLVFTLIAGFVLFQIWIKYFPKTGIGKKIFLDKDARDWQGYDKSYRELVGQTGEAHTQLRPSGTVIINKNRYDVVTRGEMIERGQSIKVIEVEGNRIVVTEHD
jgi:membrane-bound serine protease (ClpP class)